MIPVIEKRDGEWVFLVDGKRFMMLAGELHNSSSSDIRYMEERVWPYLRELHLNSLLISVAWEMIEPEEGKFDFYVLNEIIRQARREKVKLGILWFGLWKNGISSYVPEWVKTDRNRFWRVRDRYGRALDVVSPIGEAAVKADAKAFAALMENLKQTDGKEHTVILVQVENEMGILGSDRDYSEHAEQSYRQIIPSEISEIYGKFGTWEEAFGEDAPEYFMEYEYALATEQIAKAGKEIYPLPMITNAWLQQFPWRPGSYPSGGPTAKFRKMWKRVAPDIIVNAPDVYVSDFKKVCEEYAAEDNALMIPEHRRDIRHISHLFYAVGRYQALCFSPFGIEDILTPPEKLTGIGNPQVMKMLNIDPAAWKTDKTGEFLKAAYPLLAEMFPVLEEYWKKQKVQAFLRGSEHEKGMVFPLNGCELRIDYMDQAPDTPKSAGIIVESGDREIYIAGVNFRYSLMEARNTGESPVIVEYSEGRFEDGKYVRERILNGDERYCMLQTEQPVVQRLKWFC